MFASIDSLPKSDTDGPEDWSEAFGKLVGATDDAQSAVENTTSDRELLTTIYDDRIAKIESLTGTRLANPIRTAPLERRTLYSRTGMPILFSLPRDAYATGESDFDKRVAALSERFPQIASITAESVTDEKGRRMREAEARAARAAQSPSLDPVSRFGAQLAGGLAGAARDPFQWQVLGIGGGTSTAKTVAGRIGQTMLTEFAINAGAEAILQAASQERKRAAGLDHGLADALKNVGVAGTFGALFGGAVEGGAELARILKLGEGGAEQAARVIEGRPEPGDVERIAEAAGLTLPDDQRHMLERAFEDDVLDRAPLREDAPIEEFQIYKAAVRHAEDPDNFPAPEIVERAIQERRDNLGTMSADDYQRLYDGDMSVADAVRARMVPDAAPTPRAAGQADTIGDAFDQSFPADPIASARIRPDEVFEPLDDGAMRAAEVRAGRAVPAQDGAAASPAGGAAPAASAALDAVPASALPGDAVTGGASAPSKPMRAVDAVAVSDSEGRVQLMSVDEALDLADEPTFHADLLEACKL